jgi:hypothetical protein
MDILAIMFFIIMADIRIILAVVVIFVIIQIFKNVAKLLTLLTF